MIQLAVLPLSLLSLSGCLPVAQEVRIGAPIVHTTEVWQAEAHAEQPTDLLQTDRGLLVLDGYQQRMILLDDAHEPIDLIEGDDWQSPVRMAASSQGGVWLVEPDAALLRRVSDTGDTLQTVTLAEDDGTPMQPMSVLDLPDGLLISDRLGPLRWLDASGANQRSIVNDVDDSPFLGVVDLSLSGDGRVLATDTLGHRVHLLDASGTPVNAIGSFGLWAGSMHKPKSSASAVGGSLLVADSELGSVQLFDATHGTGLGLITQGDTPLRFTHPIAIRPLDASGTHFAVLDSGTNTVWGFTLTEAAVAEARTAAQTRGLRYKLSDHQDAIAGISQKTCRQCHDGPLNDNREVWDKRLVNHPVNIKPEAEIPAFFPLDDEGKIRCITCHSPHGVNDLDEVRAISNGEEVAELIRHTSASEQFTRLTRNDSALCKACHGDTPHKARTETGTDAHPSGAELLDALAEKVGKDAASLDKGCLTCHSVHGAGDKALIDPNADQKVCIPCHTERRDKKHNHPIGTMTDLEIRASAELPVSRGGGATCRSCHDLVGGKTEVLLRRPSDGGLVCLACHQDRSDVQEGKHHKVEGKHAVPCLGCHNPHSGDADRKLLLKRARTGDPNGCRGCHNKGPGRRGHPVDGKKHGDVTLVCGTCHQAHNPKPGAKAECTRCHEEQKAAKARGGHGKASCVDCHNVHGPTRLAKLAGVNPRSRRCLACHGEKTGRGDAPRIAEFEHPVPVFKSDGTRWTPLGILPLFNAQGKQVAPKANGELTCSTCHLTHGPDATKPGDNLRIPGWQDACSACHGEDALIIYRYFHNPQRRKDMLGEW